MPFWQSLKNRILAQLPNIGAHMGIEAELLLAGRKPLGWLPVPRALEDFEKREDLPQAFQKELRDFDRLQEAVARGTLIAADVVQKTPLPQGGVLQSTFRHYAQRNNAKNLHLAAAFNEKAFNGQPVSRDMLKHSIGKMLGYRRRDRWLWNNLPVLPHALQDAVYRLNDTYVRDAYQAEAVRKAEKIMKKRGRGLQS